MQVFNKPPWTDQNALTSHLVCKTMSRDEFFDNCRSFRAFIGYFLLSLSGQTHEFKIYAMRQRSRAGNLTICYRKKQIDVSFLCVCPVIDNGFRHNMVKVVCYDETHDQKQDRRMKIWRQFVILQELLISRALIGSFLSSIRVQTDKVFVYAIFQVQLTAVKLSTF